MNLHHEKNTTVLLKRIPFFASALLMSVLLCACAAKPGSGPAPAEKADPVDTPASV